MVASTLNQAALRQGRGNVNNIYMLLLFPLTKKKNKKKMVRDVVVALRIAVPTIWDQFPL